MSAHPASTPDRPPVGVSACLVGEQVRYDGNHKRHPQVVSLLANLFELIPICPEVEIGLGIPREPIQLQQTSTGLRLLGVQSGQDHTDRMQEFARQAAQQMESLQACGYILKSKSPSCGLQHVKLFNQDGSFQRIGRGIFAARLQQHSPFLPMVEEAALEETARREHFVEIVQAFHRLRNCLAGSWNVSRLLQFHHDHRLQLQSHDAQGYQELDKLVADIQEQEPATFQRTYRNQFLEILAQPVGSV